MDRVDRYRQRIGNRFPELSLGAFRLVDDEGQNNDIMIVDDRLLFRFPRYQDGVARLPHLVRMLQHIGPRVSLAVPEPIAFFPEPAEVGLSFLAYRLLPGERLTRERLATITDTSLLEALATSLATFLKEMHGIPLGEVVPDGGASFQPLSWWEDLYGRIRERLFAHMRPDARAAVVRRFEAFLGDPTNQAVTPVLVHGDFGTGNILFDIGRQAITGVLDFDDAGPGDLAVDIAAISSGPLAFIARFERVYGVSDAVKRRAEFYRGTFLLQEALHGIEHGVEADFRSGIEPYR